MNTQIKNLYILFSFTICTLLIGPGLAQSNLESTPEEEVNSIVVTESDQNNYEVIEGTEQAVKPMSDEEIYKN